MSLIRLDIQNIRNIRQASLELHPCLNLFGGDNGSGKSSLLEAVYFLGSGRSFRSHRLEPFVTRKEQSCTVFGMLRVGERTVRLGVHRSLEGYRELKINGEKQKKASYLARELPLLVLGPDTVELLMGAPADRRRFLNWGVFHVEPGFAEAWGNANRCLRQRNELLRNPSANQIELDSWTERLVECAEGIDRLRRQYCESFSSQFRDVSRLLTRLRAVKCEYIRGWDKNQNLATIYRDQKESDIKRGYTQSGFHRAEIRITVDHQIATSVCSRGELKVLAWAMVLSQGKLLAEVNDRQLLYLVDDFASELDEAHRVNICRFLLDSGGQVLATGVDDKSLQASWEDVPKKVFHVEHGTFQAKEQ